MGSSKSYNRFGFTGYEEDRETGLYYAKARYYDPDDLAFLSQDAWEGDPNIAPSLHKYLYVYQNPTVFVDRTGNEATPLFSRPIDDTTLQLPLFGTVDTGNQVADELIAGVASIPNLASSMVNAVAAGFNAPLKTASVVSGRSQEEISNEMLGFAASAGPAAPLILIGETPLLPGIALNRIKNLTNAVKPGGVNQQLGNAQFPTTNKTKEIVESDTSLTPDLKGDRFLFRGTTEGFEGNVNARAAGVTHTTTDPAVATIFAQSKKQLGDAQIEFISESKLNGIAEIPGRGTRLEKLEAEVMLDLPAKEFSNKASKKYL